FRRRAGIDLLQLADVAGDAVPTARGRRPDRRRGRRREGADAQARRLDGAAAHLREDLEAPGARAWKGYLRDVDALHVGRVAVDVPRAVRMDVDPLAPFDDLQPVVANGRFGDETRVLAFDGIDTHGDPGVGEQLSVLQEAEGQSILADEQLGRREQD